MEDEYITVNRDLWNTKTKYHLDASFYDIEKFLSNENYLSLKYTELKLLDDITDKRILHLHCHIGLNTLSLARLGAKKVVGTDLSNVAIEKASELAKKAQLNEIVEFICCDTYQLEDHLKIIDENELFDIVFTSYGTTRWFPDVNKWMGIIRAYLKPSGSFVLVDFHPIIRTFDDKYEHFGTHSYFNDGPIVEYPKGTNTDLDTPMRKKSIQWNHSIADILTALIHQSLRVDVFEELDSLPFNCFYNLCQISDEEEYQFKDFKGKLPLVYAVKATKVN